MHKSNSLLLIVIASIILMISNSSCSGPSTTPSKLTPSIVKINTSTITSTPSITPTLSYLDWPMLMSETFDDNNNSWPTGDINNESVKGTIAVTGGKFYVKLTAKKTCFWYVRPKMDKKYNTYITVKVDRKSGTKNTDYGVLLRDNYYFSINMDYQRYSFQKLSGNEWAMLTLWTNSSLIRPYEPNEISVKAMDTKFAQFINGEYVDDAQDSALTVGAAGIGITLYKAGDWIEITFDNFIVRAQSD